MLISSISPTLTWVKKFGLIQTFAETILMKYGLIFLDDKICISTYLIV